MLKSRRYAQYNRINRASPATFKSESEVDTENIRLTVSKDISHQYYHLGQGCQNCHGRGTRKEQ